MRTDITIEYLASQFLTYKRSIGRIYKTQGWVLSNYVKYHQEHCAGLLPDKEVINEYISSVPPSPGTRRIAVSVLREFCNYLYSAGYHDTYLLRNKIGNSYNPKAPYFFRESEIEALFTQIDSVEKVKGFKGRELILPTMFRLMYCCGLRCQEVRLLKSEDVHIKDQYIDIMHSKGSIDRRLFISQPLVNYLQFYDERINILFPHRVYFFPHGDRYYSEGFICNNFRKFWLQAFPNTDKESIPRAYDLRHHFAWANLNRWVTEGEDINTQLPYLMRYMGHKNIKETLYYFHFVPEFYPVYKEIAKKTTLILPEVPYDK